LFVRAGRGIESTAKARALQASVESVLDDLKSLTDHRDFDPLVEQMEFTIAANDFPIQLIFPKLLRELSEEGVQLRIRFIPSGIPSVSILRASRYRMLITPTPPDDPELEKVIRRSTARPCQIARGQRLMAHVCVRHQTDEYSGHSACVTEGPLLTRLTRNDLLGLSCGFRWSLIAVRTSEGGESQTP
jgi:DNA-binding transcriptional LysR family regulator